jgi:aspartate racemase
MIPKTIGILGGMGPEATADLYREIINLTPAERDQDHIPVLIYSNPLIPDRTLAIMGKGEDPVPVLLESALRLQNAGADFLAMPCNTAHYFLSRMEPHLSIPVVHMIEETCSFMRKSYPGVKKAGLLAATGTVFSGIYLSACGRAGIELLVPEERSQEQVHQSILDVKRGQHGLPIRRRLEKAGADLVSRGAGLIILGCTEIPLVLDPERVDYPCANATRILAKACVERALQRSL